MTLKELVSEANQLRADMEVIKVHIAENEHEIIKTLVREERLHCLSINWTMLRRTVAD